jgi:hypothetical protein
MFYYDPIVHDSIESFKKYYDIILEANQEDLEATFKRINRYSSENKIPVAKYPFSKTTLGRTIHEHVSMSSFCLKTQSVVDGCQPSHIFHSPLLGTNIDISRPLSATNYLSAPSEDPVSYSFGTSVSETPLDECFKPL